MSKRNKSKSRSFSRKKSKESSHNKRSNENKPQYIQKKELGRGGFGIVYLVEDQLDNNQEYAMKEIEASNLNDAYYEQLFQQEIQIMNHLSNLKNPNILQLYRVFNTGNHYYLIMEYCPEGNLDNYIKRKKRLSEKESTLIMLQILNGMKGLQELSIIH